ncbi:hypothetical protein T03_7080 [Trichinella britovi]|uniref:Uncharacterized protein n=1 Tax=Trichinella britovi TaxID=45882 RepID=A0A0V0YQ93_TRIBR|nr:hypothetical protein T03_7080 [Trichinella britovi]
MDENLLPVGSCKQGLAVGGGQAKESSSLRG